MRAGRIEQVGPFEEIRRQPANTFVAGFLGIPPMSLLPDAVVDQGGIDAGRGLRIVPQASQLQALRSGQRVTVGIPAESAKVSVDEDGPRSEAKGRPQAPANSWQGTVESVEPDYGRQVQFIGVRSGENLFLGQADVRERIALRERIVVQFDDTGLHFFDDENGDRLA